MEPEPERRWRPRTRLQPEFDRWVLRAALAVGLDLSADERERIADAAEEAAARVVTRAFVKERERRERDAASLDAQIETEATRRERHRYELEQRREMLSYDRRRGLG